MELIERSEEWRKRYAVWQRDRGPGAPRNELGKNYPFVENRRAPFTPARRALPMLNLALVTSAGAYIDGTEPFDCDARNGDTSFREIPVEVEAEDLRYSSWGYDATAVRQDRNAQIPVDRLMEFTSNGIIGQLNPVFWSLCGFVPDATRVIEELVPKLVERVKR
ncbi:MAG TPA: glycine/sarcosine/betaine reductase selenoprotein B family protein, partial [Pyrinomonadaceae bacterium]